MKALARLRRAFRSIRIPFTLREEKGWLRSRAETASRIFVDEGAAVSCIAVLACVRAIAETLASLPLKIYTGEGRRKAEARSHAAWALLHDRPNPLMTSMVFREALVSHVVLTGNAFAWIDFDQMLQPRALWLLRPDLVRVEKKNGALLYHVRPETGGREVTLSADQVLHVPGLGYDGTRGYSPVRLAAEGIGLALAQERFAGSLFGRGARPSGVLQTDKELSDEAYDRLREDMAENEGLENANKTLILEDGLKWQQVTIAPNDAQFLESRNFQGAEICRLFRVPASIVGFSSGDSSTYANVEQRHLEFRTLTLLPTAVRIEQELDRKLFVGRDAGRYYTKHVLAGFLRADAKTRSEFYAKLFPLGALSPNDIRELEDWGPAGDEGDTYFVQSGLAPIDKAAQGLSMGPSIKVSTGSDAESK